MHNLFSHAHEPDYESPRETETFEEAVVVAAPRDHAFDGLTDSVHLWWPVAEQSVLGEGSHIAFLRDHLVEEGEDGEEIIWADILDWQAAERIALQWILGDSHSEVEIRLTDADEGMTQVTIVAEQYSGQESEPDNAFLCDWSLILSRYARFMGGAVPLD